MSNILTPGRAIRAVLGSQYQAVTDLPYGNSRKSEEISDEHMSGVHIIPGMGIELRPVNLTSQEAAERNDATGGPFVVGTDMVVAPGHIQENTWRSPSDLTGATTGATNLASVGRPMVRKQVADGDSFDISLASPYPGVPSAPFRYPGIPVYSLSWTAATVYDDEPNQSLLFEFEYRGGSGILFRIYFTGPPRNGNKFTGKGLYVCDLWANGLATFIEYGTIHNPDGTSTDAWNSNAELHFRWSRGEPSKGHHRVYIRPFAIDNGDRGYQGGQIALSASNPGSAQSPQFGRLVGGAKPSSFSVAPIPANIASFVDGAPVALQVPIPSRARWQLAAPVYPSSGTLRDKPFSFNIPPAIGTAVTIEVHGQLGAFGSVNVQLFDIKDNEISLDSSDGLNFTFLIPDSSPDLTPLSYYVVLTLGTSDTTKSPLITSYGIAKNGVSETVGDGDIVIDLASPGSPEIASGNKITAFILNGGGEDSATESSSLSVSDLSGALVRPDQRGDLSIRVEATCGWPWTTEKSVISRGFVREPKRRPRARSRGNNSGYEDAQEWTFPIIGMQKLSKDTPCSIRWNFINGVTSGDLPLVTDIVRTILNWLGWTTNRIDIPDLPVKVSGLDNDAVLVEPGTDLWELAQRLTQDYLGYILYFDHNASPTADPTDYLGMVRMRPSPHFAASPLAWFTRKDTSTLNGGGEYLGLDGKAYGTVSIGGNTVQRAYVGIDYWDRFEPPEANYVLVSGTGGTVRDANFKDQKVYIEWNQKSFNFDNTSTPDPNAPDRLDYIKQVLRFDKGLNNSDAVRVTGRRLAQQTFHARKWRTFSSVFLYVKDVTDVYACRPRPLRYGDTVIFEDLDGTQHSVFIYDVTADFQTNSRQLAAYETLELLGYDQ